MKWILIIVFCFLLMACSGDNKTVINEGVELGDDVALSGEEIKYTIDVPDVDMDGKIFNLFGQNWWGYMPLSIADIQTDELNGDLLNDAVYNRNLTMEQKFNCKVEIYHIESPDEGYQKAISSIMAGDDTYDILLMRAVQYNRLLLSKGLIELTDIPYLEFNNPWWDSNSFNELAIKGRKYVVVSDITTNNYLSIYCVYFNKDMITDYNMNNPYTLVNDGKWTIDEMYNMGKQVAADVDGNGIRNTKDNYGFTYVDDMPEGLLNSIGVRLATLDNDGIPQITALDETSISKMQHLYALLEDPEVSLNCHRRSSQPQTDETGMFMNNQVLFSLGGIYYAPEMRQMDSDFGIIPYPKYDTKQQTYNMPMLGATVTYTALPVTNLDFDNTGIFMEYYAYLGYIDVLPALYEKLLLGKVARDEESSEMLDYIFSNKFYDTGMICDFGGLRSTLRDLYVTFKGTFTSTLASIEEKIQLNIDDLISEM